MMRLLFLCLLFSTVSAQQVTSFLEIMDTRTGSRKVIYEAPVRFEAPNWSRNGKYLLFNQEGRLYRVSVEKKEKPVMIDTGLADRCNNDHGYSFDGKTLAISHNGPPDGLSRIYILPAGGGIPQLVTPNAPSYWHGWSPDGTTLVYCAERENDFDIYAISVQGGPEKQLTSTPGLDDGPEYSPDGKYIYFNSVRAGNMHIYRMFPDGSAVEQLTFDDQYNDWFPHLSPDNKKVVFISFGTDVPPSAHPPYKQVWIRMMDPDGKNIRTLAALFGGQGTINVPSWSPDSNQIAFVSYKLTP